MYPQFNKNISNTKIVVAMSGGVDSSVVAALMHEKGYEVIGITLQLYNHSEIIQNGKTCCAGQDIEDARNVCEMLGIPHYVLNYESLFKESVIDDFADSYIRGETPIPCVKCNQSVKFKDLLGVAKDLGADAMVTGHYVQRIQGEFGAELHSGIDQKKDQSYFLFATTKEQLDYLYFPIGNMTKNETRKLAERFNLNVADKPDSQDICFVPNGNYASIVSKLRPGALDTGSITHVDGRELGQHNGTINFTIGQRKGLGISSPTPLYVVKIEPNTNNVIVGDESDLYSNSFYIKELNWLGNNKKPDDEQLITVKLRSTHKGAEAKIYSEENGLFKIILTKPERAITSGQACVVYDGARVLGGGWIVG